MTQATVEHIFVHESWGTVEHVVVHLSWEQQEWVRSVGLRVSDVYEEGVEASMKYRAPGDSIETPNLNGFGAELAVAIWCGGHWNEGRWGVADIDDDIEVRSSRHRDGHLLLYVKDKPLSPFVLATGSFPGPYEIHGWLPCAAGKHERWRHEKGELAAIRANGSPIELKVNLWAVPQEFLYALETFTR